MSTPPFNAGDVVLLNVNDDEATRYSVTRILRHAGYRVVEADSGEGALHAVKAERPMLVILDVKLPDMNGFDVCRLIKRDHNCAVLHLSALAVDSKDRITGLEVGADAYVTQPVEPQVLLATVRSLLRMQHAEAASRSAADQWQASFDALRDGVALIGPSGRVTRCNRAFDQIFGRKMTSERVFGDGGALPNVRANDAQKHEIELGERYFQLSVDQYSVEHEDRGAVAVLVDVTERKLLERALTERAELLAESDRRKDEFLAMLAHELRNPLSAVTSALELLPDVAGARRVSEVIRRQTLHVARLIDELLDVSRIRRGRVELKKKPVDLCALLRQFADGQAARMASLGHQLVSEIASGPIYVMGDATRLEQALANLLDNAARYTPYGGTVTIRLAQQDGNAVLEVQDTGDGIPKDMLEKVFELFIQLNVKIDRQKGGLGIGLTMVKNIVEMHGGTVRAHSEGPGKGSTFTLTLPLTSALQPAEPLPAKQAVHDRSCCKILIVEDNADAREMLTDLLESWGHSVVAEGDGLAGLKRALEGGFQLGILDIGLPQLDGYSIAREIRASGKLDDMFLVALTGYGSADERSRSAQAGFDLHMVKPVDVEQLAKVIGGLRPSHSPADNSEARREQLA